MHENRETSEAPEANRYAAPFRRSGRITRHSEVL